LGHQVDRSRSKQQEATGLSALTPSPIDQATQDLKQIRHAVDLIENDEPVGMAFQVKLRLAQFCAIRVRFQIKINRGPFITDLLSERRLADLPWPKQGNRRRVIDPCDQFGLDPSFNHPCIIGSLFRICKVILHHLHNLKEARMAAGFPIASPNKENRHAQNPLAPDPVPSGPVDKLRGQCTRLRAELDRKLVRQCDL
jgi:hypothetical protein